MCGIKKTPKNKNKCIDINNRSAFTREEVGRVKREGKGAGQGEMDKRGQLYGTDRN